MNYISFQSWWCFQMLVSASLLLNSDPGDNILFQFPASTCAKSLPFCSKMAALWTAASFDQLNILFGGERVLSTCLQITERVNINHDWFVVVQVSFKDLLSADSACCIAASFKFADFKSSNFFGFLSKVVTGTWSNSDEVDISLDRGPMSYVYPCG